MGLLSLLLFKTRISCACYLQHSLSICSLLASFFITFLNLVKHLYSLRETTVSIWEDTSQDSSYEYSDCRTGWRGSCCCPWPFLLLPARTAAAVVELWGTSGKWIGLKLWSSFSDGFISQVHYTVQQHWASSRAVEEGEERLENSTTEWFITWNCAPSIVCMLEAQPWSSARRQKANLFPSLESAKRKLVLSVNRTTPIRHPQGTLNAHTLNSRDPKTPWGVCIGRDIPSLGIT